MNLREGKLCFISKPSNEQTSNICSLSGPDLNDGLPDVVSKAFIG